MKIRLFGLCRRAAEGRIKMKKLIALLTMFAMLISQSAVFAADIKNTQINDSVPAREDTVYNEAYELLNALGMITNTGKSPLSQITREEFAYSIAYIYGVVNKLSDGGNDENDKYNGYTNNEIKDDWIWEADKPAEEENTEIKNTGTPFYDVTTDNPYYGGIYFVAQTGCMKGSDGYFRPGERLTFAEMMKVMVDILSAGFTSGGNYPDGYMSAAAAMNITDGMNSLSIGGFVTYRDFIVCLKNTLEADNYIIAQSANVTYKQNGKSFLENQFSIAVYEGTVLTNSVTSIDSTLSASVDSIAIGNESFICDPAEYDEYLGYYVKAYYRKENENKLLYMTPKKNRNKTLEIDAEDIISYNAPYLEYAAGKSYKKEYLGSQTVIIRNNILLDNYEQSELLPVEGNIKFLDNNNDGNYEYAFIDAVETLLVNFLDGDKKIIFDKLSGKQIDLSKKDELLITDINGDAAELEDISPNAVLEVRDTLGKQNPQKTWIKVVYKTVVGSLKSVDRSKRKLTVDDKQYDLSPRTEDTSLKVGKAYIFYLDSKSKVVGFSASDSELIGAYLIKFIPDDAGETFFVRLWEYKDNKFNTYELADKVKLNGERVKSEEVGKSPEVINPDTNKTIAQLVDFKRNGDNKITELVTSNNMTLLYAGSSSNLQYRTVPGAFMSTIPEFYADTDVPYIKVPSEEVTNEDLYSVEKLQQDKKYKVTAAYTNKEDSLKATVVVEKQQDSAASAAVTSDREPVYIITNISEECVDDDIYTAITCENKNGQKKILVERADRFNSVNDYHAGDLIRVTYYEKIMKAIAIERLFDCRKMMFDDTSYYWSDTFSNPIKGSNLSDQHYVAGFGLAHGTPIKRYDDGELINLALYKYTRDELTGELLIDKGERDKNLLLKTDGFVVYMFDKKTKTLEKLNVNSTVFDEENTGANSSEIIAYSVWGEPNIIFMYK